MAPSGDQIQQKNPINILSFPHSFTSINPIQKNPTLCLSCVNGQTTLCLSANKPESANQKQKNTWTRTNRLIQMYQKKRDETKGHMSYCIHTFLTTHYDEHVLSNNPHKLKPLACHRTCRTSTHISRPCRLN